MKVMKFGGTSVGKPERMHEVAKLITVGDENKIIVLSALSGTTNSLVEISISLSQGDRAGAKQQIDALEKHYQQFILQLVKTDDAIAKAKNIIAEHFEFLNIILKISYSEALNKDILAQGELLSTKLFSTYLESQGIDHLLIPALDFMTIDNYDEPQIGSIKVKLSQILKKHKDKKIFVTQGYISRNSKGEIDNLKRGGSDYSASLIAAAINASVCEIWTDIDGMHNNDPRVVSKTVAIEQLSFEEAAELAYFGAKILHPTCILPAKKRNIPVRLKNTMLPEAQGTLIANINTNEGVKAVAAKDGITAINIKSDRMLLAHGFLRAVFEIFERYKTPIDMITTSEVAVSLTIDQNKNLAKIIEELKEISLVEIDIDQTIICIVGQLPKDKSGYAYKVLEALKDIPLRMVSYGGSANNISVLVNSNLKNAALMALNKGLFNYN